MHIAISARCLSSPIGGVREYAWSFIRHLLALNAGHTFTLYLADPALAGTFPAAREVVVRAPHKLFWDHVVLPRHLARDRPDAVWFPQNVIPLGVRTPAVVTVTDLLYFPLAACPGREYAWPDTLYMRHFIPRSARQARRIAAISRRTADDLARIAGRPRAEIDVVPLAPSAAFHRRPPAETDAVLERHGVRRPYFLYSGSLSPRKNVPRLLDAFAPLRAVLPHELVLTGAGIARRNPTHARIRRLPPDARVRLLGPVGTEDLAALYSGAEALVFPSLYEGFGLPPLEAFACGCPVVCSTAGALPEVTGDAALAFDPLDVEGLSEAMRRVATDAALRAGLVERGTARAAGFSYVNSARALLNLLEAAARDPLTPARS